MSHYPRHVSGFDVPIFRRNNCTNTASGILALLGGCTLYRLRADCALKLVLKNILYYDARSEKHQKKSSYMFQTLFNKHIPSTTSNRLSTHSYMDSKLIFIHLTPTCIDQTMSSPSWNVHISNIITKLSLLLHRASCRFTNHHTTNKCTNYMSFILNHFFKTLSLLLHVSIAYRLSSSGSTYSS